jgi:hypothetical protein
LSIIQNNHKITKLVWWMKVLRVFVIFEGKFKIMETKDRYILDIIDDGIQEAFRRFRIEEKNRQSKQTKVFQAKSYGKAE